MTHDQYDAVAQGIVFGAALMFLFMLALMYALALTPSEKLEECQSIKRLNNEHTHTQ